MREVLKSRRSSIHPNVVTAGASSGNNGDQGSRPDIEHCLKSVGEFSREVARHSHVMLMMGSASDGRSVRDELRRIRRRACELARNNNSHLQPNLRRDASCPERERFEKLWNVFSAGLELLYFELCKALKLTLSFSLQSESCVLIRTGLSEPGCSRVFITTESSDRDVQLLKRDVYEVGCLLAETENKVDIQPWTFEVDPETSKFYETNRPADVESVYSQHTTVRCSRLVGKKKYVFVATIVVIVVIAAVLGACLAILI